MLNKKYSKTNVICKCGTLVSQEHDTRGVRLVQTLFQNVIHLEHYSEMRFVHNVYTETDIKKKKIKN